MSDAVLEFSCRACGGALVFHASTRALSCPSCGAQTPMSECDQPAGHRDLVATLAALREQCDGSPPDRAAAGPAREFACPNCHGHLGFTGTLTATACPFCAAPVQRADIHAAENHVPVDGIVPFAIDTDAAEAAVRRWLRTVLFAPTAFKRSGTPGSVSAVYLPFFTFDAGTVTNYTGQRGKRISKTVLWRDVAGTVTKVFDDVAVPAEDSMDRKRLRELEPWETSVAVAFRPEFLAGALARRHDRELADCAADAEKLMEAEVCKAICADIGGAEQRITRADPIWSNQVYRHLLLPVFVLVVPFGAARHQVWVNGRTGEVHGDQPYSWIKIGLTVLAVLGALIVGGVALNLGSEDTAGVTVDSGPQVAAGDARSAQLVACTNAVVAYRAQTPDTYFPDTSACASLRNFERARVARVIFRAEQVRAAEQRFQAAETAGPRARCEAAQALKAAQVRARVDVPKEVKVAAGCESVSPEEVKRLRDEAEAAYEAQQTVALAEAP